MRNGRAKERGLTVGSGTMRLRAPRVNDKRVDPDSGERKKFSSRILPAYARRSPKVTDVLPVLYLRGLSTGDFGPALRDLLGEDASGLSASSVQRLTEQWQADHAAFRQRSLRFHKYAYLFVDGIHMSIASVRTIACACSSSSASARTARRNCSPSRTATARAPTPGPPSCATSRLVA